MTTHSGVLFLRYLNIWILIKIIRCYNLFYILIQLSDNITGMEFRSMLKLYHVCKIYKYNIVNV